MSDSQDAPAPEGVTPEAEGGAQKQEPVTLESLQKAIQQVAETMQGRHQALVGDLAKVRKKVKEVQGEGGEQAKPAPAGLSMEDVKSLMQLEQAKAGLTSEQQALIDQASSAGAPAGVLASMAEALRKAGSAKPTPKREDRGFGATPASPTGVPRVTTMSQLKALLKKDRAAYDAVVDSPGFDWDQIDRSK